MGLKMPNKNELQGNIDRFAATLLAIADRIQQDAKKQTDESLNQIDLLQAGSLRTSAWSLMNIFNEPRNSGDSLDQIEQKAIVITEAVIKTLNSHYKQQTAQTVNEKQSQPPSLQMLVDQLNLILAQYTPATNHRNNDDTASDNARTRY